MVTPTVAASYRILVIDDVESSRAVLSRQIMLAAEAAECPCICDSAESGRQAVELCLKTEYDMVVTDYNMPGENGGATARKILAIYPHVPIIGYTETTSLEELVDCLFAGMEKIVDKNPTRIRQIATKMMKEKFLAQARKKGL